MGTTGEPPRVEKETAAGSAITRSTPTQAMRGALVHLPSLLLWFKGERFAHENGVGSVLREKLAAEGHAVGRTHTVRESENLW